MVPWEPFCTGVDGFGPSERLRITADSLGIAGVQEELRDAEACPLALCYPSPGRAAATHSHPAKLLLCPGPISPSQAEPKPPPHSPQVLCTEGAQRRGTWDMARLPSAVPTAR